MKPKYLGPTSAIFTPEPGVQEIVIIVAPPACGKTTLSKKFDENIYYRINQDTLRTIDKCILKAKEELKTGKCMIMFLKLLFRYSSYYFSSLFLILLFYSTVILSSHRFFLFPAPVHSICLLNFFTNLIFFSYLMIILLLALGRKMFGNR